MHMDEASLPNGIVEVRDLGNGLSAHISRFGCFATGTHADPADLVPCVAVWIYRDGSLVAEERAYGPEHKYEPAKEAVDQAVLKAVAKLTV